MTLELLLILIVELITVAMALVDEVCTICFFECSSRSYLTWVRAKTHCTALDYTFLIFHKVNYWMFAKLIEFAAVCICIAKNTSCKFNYGNLHSKTDTKIWQFIGTRITA